MTDSDYRVAQFAHDDRTRPRHRCFARMAVAFAATLLATGGAVAQVGGNLAQFPPSDLHLEISTSAAGDPVLSKTEFQLTTGDYYRLNVKCTDVIDDRRGWRYEMRELLQNSHLRLVSVGDIEIHLQALTFHAVECDEVGLFRVSFVPIKPGTYDLYVGNVPSAIGRPIGEAGVQREGKFVLGRFVVK